MERTLSHDQLVLVTLLAKLGVMASIAALLGRFAAFKRQLSREELTLKGKWIFALLAGMLLSLGVMSRLLLGYQAADLSLEGTLLVGLLTGPLTGATVGLMVGIPAVFRAEYLALPLGLIYGLTGGVVRAACRREDIWGFSPLIFLNVFRTARRAWQERTIDRQLIIFGVAMGLESLRIFAGREMGSRFVFHLASDHAWVLAAIYLSTLSCLGIPLKIWNNIRLEQKLAQQEVLVVRARLEALSRQINPHFLFNTLNSIAAATRKEPELARRLIQKLSSVLRKLLEGGENFIPLKEELELVDSYLDIESVRFGSGKLLVEKQLQSDALETIVPAMILQPLVENAVKHGIAKRLNGGRIVIRARRDNGLAIIEIEDNGVGLPTENTSGDGLGIGLMNVNERLKVIYGERYQLRLTSRPGEGTLARLAIPDLDLSLINAR
jgi:two-component system LytT family sensor kinase